MQAKAKLLETVKSHFLVIRLSRKLLKKKLEKPPENGFPPLHIRLERLRTIIAVIARLLFSVTRARESEYVSERASVCLRVVCLADNTARLTGPPYTMESRLAWNLNYVNNKMVCTAEQGQRGRG